jgi:hypothetical protein
MPETILGDVASRHWLYLAARPSHLGGRCGQASLLPAPSYGLHPSDEVTGLPIRRCLVPSLQWVVVRFWVM